MEELARAVAADRARGAKPFLVIGNAGSVNTGAVDDLSALADLAREEGLWFHVDGAYGGFFLLTERGRKTMAGAERSDSITLDPHKSLFLPYGTGSLLVRDGDALKRAHALSAVYLPSMQEDPDLVDFNQISPELSRSWRGLRALAADQDARHRPLPREPRREARSRRVGGRGAQDDPRHRDPRRAPALDHRVPVAPAGPGRRS